MLRPPFPLLVAVALATACACPPPPLALPPVRVAVRYVPGPAAAGGADSPQRLHIEALTVRAPIAGDAIEAVVQRVASEDGAPFRAASPLPPGSRWLAGAAATDWLAQRGRLGPADLQSRGEGEAVLASPWQTRADVTALPVPVLRWVWQHEATGNAGPQLWLENTTAAGRRSELRIDAAFTRLPAVLFVADPGAAHAGHAVVLTARGTADAAAIDAVEASAERHAVVAAAPALPAPWRTALAAVGSHQRRAAFLALARPLRVPRALDLVLVADEAALVAIAAAFAASDAQEVQSAWPFERAVWLGLLPLADRGELTLALHAAFVRHLGALAQDPGSLHALLATANDADAFAALLRDENEQALADRDPAQRCAGHDWLEQHDAAVPGYAPLDPPAARRQALRRHAAAREGGR